MSLEALTCWLECEIPEGLFTDNSVNAFSNYHKAFVLKTRQNAAQMLLARRRQTRKNAASQTGQALKPGGAGARHMRHRWHP